MGVYLDTGAGTATVSDTCVQKAERGKPARAAAPGRTPSGPRTGRGIEDQADETEDLMAQDNPGLDSALSVRAVATVAAGEERKKLRRSVGRLDTAFLMLAAIIVLDTL